MEVWTGEDWIQAELKGDVTIPSYVLRKTAPSIHWDEIKEPLHNGLNTVARLIFSASQGNRFDIRQLILKAEASAGITLDGDEIVPFLVNGLEFKPLAPAGVYYAGWGRAVFWDYGDYIVDGDQGPLTIELRLNVSGVVPDTFSFVQVKLDDFNGDDGLHTMELTGYEAPNVLHGWDVPQQPGPPITSALFWTDRSQEEGHDLGFPTSPDYFGKAWIANAYGISTVYTQ